MLDSVVMGMPGVLCKVCGDRASGKHYGKFFNVRDRLNKRNGVNFLLKLIAENRTKKDMTKVFKLNDKCFNESLLRNETKRLFF